MAGHRGGVQPARRYFLPGPFGIFVLYGQIYACLYGWFNVVIIKRMLSHILKPYSLLLYLLALIAAFLVGVSYAGIVDAGKGQGLAGGAIVLGYGVVAAAIGLLLALLLAYKAKRKTIFRLNILLTCCIAVCYLYLYLKFLERQREKAQTPQQTEQPQPATKPLPVPKSF
ncbi:MAG: hypothetical protein D6730_13100 [Bacteroidetes bacterium]|nr:MAG: hypothetical protein D6730_13100 [Bacteroidota bacterium]